VQYGRFTVGMPNGLVPPCFFELIQCVQLVENNCPMPCGSKLCVQVAAKVFIELVYRFLYSFLLRRFLYRVLYFQVAVVQLPVCLLQMTLSFLSVHHSTLNAALQIPHLNNQHPLCPSPISSNFNATDTSDASYYIPLPYGRLATMITFNVS